MPYAMCAVLNAEWVVGFSWRFSSGLTGKEGAFTKANEWVQEELAYKQTWNAGTIQLASAWSPKKNAYICTQLETQHPVLLQNILKKTWRCQRCQLFRAIYPLTLPDRTQTVG